MLESDVRVCVQMLEIKIGNDVAAVISIYFACLMLNKELEPVNNIVINLYGKTFWGFRIE